MRSKPYTSCLDTFTRKKQTNKIFSCNLHDFIKKKNITTKIQRISPCCSAADSIINSRHNNFTFSHVLTFRSICHFVAICKRKHIFCKMVTNWVKRKRMKTFIAEVWRAKRACGAPWVSNSTHLKKIGEHVTVHRPSVRTTGKPMFNLTLPS